MKNFNANREFINKVTKIAVPIALQSVIMSALNMVDQLMVGQLGQETIAAVGLSNRVIVILTILLNSIATGVSIYAAQFWGAKETKNIGQLLGIGILAGGVPALVFFLLSIFVPEFCVGIFSSDYDVIAGGVAFLRILAYSYFPMVLSVMFSAVLRSTGHVMFPMAASITGVIVNIILDYLLIFGNFGFPKLGLQGSAIGTVLARIAEFLIIIISTYSLKLPAAFKPSAVFGLSKTFMRSLVKTTYPIIINEFLWVLGETVYSIIYGRIGTAEYTAVAITFPIQGLTIGLLSGLSAAAGVILGNLIGDNRNDTVMVYARKFIRLGIGISVCLGLLTILISRFYISAYNISGDASRYSGYLMMAFAIFLWIKVSNMIIGAGILPSGGDSKFLLIMESSATWLFGVPSGLIAAFVLHLPVYWVYTILSCEELIRFIFGFRRVYSRRWIRNLIGNEKADEQIYQTAEG